MDRPFSRACENNKAPILEQLELALDGARLVLEIGSGTGQHAVHFAAHMPRSHWQTSDRRQNHAGIAAWIAHSGATNVAQPLDLDVDDTPWPITHADAVFSANTAHIMAWPSVVNMFAGVATVLPASRPFVLYGPFAYAGRHTSASNERFDASLRAQDSAMGVRDVERLSALSHGLSLVADHPMPANNRLLVWRRD